MLLTPQELPAFRSRFCDFHDGVVREVLLGFGGGADRCRVVVDCKDRNSGSGWARVELAIEGVTRCRFELGRTTFEVLSEGIHIEWLDAEVLIVLDASPNGPQKLPDLSRNTAYVSGRRCNWSAVSIGTRV